jgi:ABC-type multidrug transport system fused ATPase/permease subunit
MHALWILLIALPGIDSFVLGTAYRVPELKRIYSFPKLRRVCSNNIAPLRKFNLMVSNGEKESDDMDTDKPLIRSADKDVTTPARKAQASSRLKFEGIKQPDFAIIEMRGVNLRYGDKEVLKDATLTAASGERVGLVGPNGCGEYQYPFFCGGDRHQTQRYFRENNSFENSERGVR